MINEIKSKPQTFGIARSASAAAVGLLQLGKGHVLVAEARRGALVARRLDLAAARGHIRADALEILGVLRTLSPSAASSRAA